MLKKGQVFQSVTSFETLHLFFFSLIFLFYFSFFFFKGKEFEYAL